MNNKKLIWYWYISIFSALVCVSVLLYQWHNDHDLRIYFFDVGQGDAALIRTADHRNIIIDGGPDNSVLYQLGKVLPWYDRTIDAVLLTHPHADHLVGLIEMLRRYDVKNIIITQATSNTPYARTWTDEIKKEHAHVIIITQPQTLYFGTTTIFHILFPDGKTDIAHEKDLNNTSIVGKLTYGAMDVLFMGDYQNEESLVNTYDLASEVIKVGHHGSRNATSAAFAHVVSPRYAIICQELAIAMVIRMLKHSRCGVPSVRK